MFPFLSLCTPSGVQSQVVPRKYTLNDENVGQNSPARTVDVVRLKPQPTGDGLAQSTTLSLSVEEELAIFSLDIKFASSSFCEEHFGATILALGCFSFDNSTVKASSGLVSILRATVDRYKSYRIDGSVLSVSRSIRTISTAQSAQKLSQQEYGSSSGLASACKALAQVLASSLQPGQENSSTGRTGMKLGLIEKMAILTDILLAAVVESTIIDMSKEGVRLEEALLFETNKLLRALLTLMLASPTAGGVTASMRVFSQIWCKACHISGNMLQYASYLAGAAGSATSLLVRNVLDDIAQLAQLTAEALGTMHLLVESYETSCGSEGNGAFGCYYCTLLYWRLCSHIGSAIVLQRQSLSNTAPEGRAFSDTLNARVYATMLSTLPTVEAVRYEFQRIAAYKADSELFLLDRQYLQLLESGATSGSMIQMGGLDGPHCSFKLRYLFAGLAYICHDSHTAAVTSTVADPTLSAQQQRKWLVALAELLVSVLNKARSGVASLLLPYAPYLAKCVLQLLCALRSSGVGALDGADWVFWELAKGMNDFTILMRRQLRALNNAHARGSGYSGQSGTGANCAHGGASIAASQGSMRSAATASSSSKMHKHQPLPDLRHAPGTDRPLGTLKAVNNSNMNNTSARAHLAPLLSPNSFVDSPVILTEQAVSVDNTPKVTYTVGDKVDGQCTLPNGTKRWYPGHVTEVKIDANKRLTLITVKFSDGEEKVIQDLGDIRHPKKRKQKGERGLTSTEDESSGYDSEAIGRRRTDSAASADESPWVSHRGGVTSDGAMSASVDLKSANIALYRLQVQDRPHQPAPQPAHPHVPPAHTSTTEGISLAPMLSPAPVATEELHRRPSVALSIASLASAQESHALEDSLGESLAEAGGELEAQQVDYSDDGGDEAGSDDNDSKEEDRVFEIPSVFEGGHRTMPSAASLNNSSGNKLFKEGLVPRIQFEDLDAMSTGSGLAQSYSNMSLSGALLSDAVGLRSSMTNNGFHSFRTNNGDGTSRSNKAGLISQMTSHRSYVDNSFLSVSGEDQGNFPHIQLPHILLPGFGSHKPGHDSGYPEEPTTGGNTRMMTWRGLEESAHTVNTAVIGGKMPANPPSSAHQSAQDKVLRKGNPGGASAKGGVTDAFSPLEESYLLEVPEGFRRFCGLGMGIADADVLMLLKTYGIITAIFLQRAVVPVAPQGASGPGRTSPDLLDSFTCTSAEHPSPLRSPLSAMQASAAAMAAASSQSLCFGSGQSVNLLFTVREFLEISAEVQASTPPGGKSRSNSPLSKFTTSAMSPMDTSLQHAGTYEGLIRFNLQQNHASLRLCKLLQGDYFKHTCLVQHISGTDSASGARLAEKIGEGGFGTVFRVACNCPPAVGFTQHSNCLGCYRKDTSTESTHSPSTTCTCWRALSPSANTTNTTPAQRQFAIKRIPRERSMHDPSRLYDLYCEVSALEALRGRRAIGVCGLEDFGVVGSEYWIVMELGSQNLEEYRGAMTSVVTSPRAIPGKAAPLSMQQVATCLALFLDALLILQSVHAADIAHFDIKGSNFMLRQQVYDSAAPLPLLELRTSHEKNEPSGYVFLGDFGEAVSSISSPASTGQVRARCRGTLHIQSPEMICISQSGTGTASIVGTNNNSGASLPALGSAQSAAPPPVKNARRTFALPDQRSDIWSLGCLLVELLTGIPLFAEKPWPELYMTLCMEKFSTLHILVPTAVAPVLQQIPGGVRTRIEEVIFLLLQQMPEDRPALSAVITKVKAVLTDHFPQFLESPAGTVEVSALAVPAARSDVTSSNTIDALRAQAVLLTPALHLNAPIGPGVQLSLGRHQTKPHHASILAPLLGFDRAVAHASLDTAAAEASSHHDPHQQRITVHLHSHIHHLDLQGARNNNTILSAALPDNAEGATLVQIVDHVRGVVRRVLQATKASSAPTSTPVRSHVVIAVEGDGSAPFTPSGGHRHQSSDGASTNRLLLSVAMAISAVLADALREKNPDNSAVPVGEGLVQLAQLWRCLPHVAAHCDQQLVHQIIAQIGDKTTS